MDFEKKEIIKKLNQLLTIYDCLDEKLYGILSLRNGFNNGVELTLEEVGKKYNLSRARVGQLLEEAKKKIKWRILRNGIYDKLSKIYKYIVEDIKLSYITIDAMADFFEDDSVSYKIVYLFEIANKPITYSKDYRLIYDSSEERIEDIVDSITSVMKYSYSFEKYDELPMCAKAIVKREYRNNYNSYVRKDSNRSKEIEKVVYKYFPNGFRPSDDEQLALFNQKLKVDLGITNEYSSKNILALLNRGNYSLIDRGTYISKEQIIQLPSNLLDEISSYIKKMGHAIAYMDLYDRYEDDLKRSGVMNYFHLKGILDATLSEEFTHQKDFIIYDKTKTIRSSNKCQDEERDFFKALGIKIND